MHLPTSFSSSKSQGKVEKADTFYHPELDVLRFVAFLAVFFHHALPRGPELYLSNGLSPAITHWILAAKEAGAYGVDLFFVLSSYLITALLLREHESRGYFSVPAFYMRRTLRIWPLYFTFLAATVFLIPLVLPDEQFGPIYVVSFAFFLGNWSCAAYGLPFSVANPLWSISVEEQFYLGWPLLLLLFGIHRIKLLAIILIGVALGTRIFLAVYGYQHPAVWCNTFARLDAIAAGAILAVSLRGRTPQLSNAIRLLFTVVAVGSVWLAARYLKQDGPTSVVTFSITAMASVLLLMSVLKPDVPRLRVAPFSWLVYLGRISYGLYVFHLLALTLIAKISFIPLVGIPLNFERRLILSLVLTVSMAAISYTWLEQPFLRLKKRFSYRAESERDFAQASLSL
jgi:peptidoglycan/LPS O-acetylase OafA/YrhL